MVLDDDSLDILDIDGIDACSERSDVAQSDTCAAASDVGAEIEAMTEVARVLESLEDPQARVRVLRRAMELYCVDPIGLAAPETPATIAVERTDPTLDVRSLSDLFPATQHADAAQDELSVAAPAKPTQGSGIESLIRGFADDFRRFALEWNGV